MRLIKTLLCGVAVALSSCVSLLPDAAPADVIYRLGAINEGVPQSPLAKVIRIDRPRASSAFQGKDIVVSPDGRRLASAAQAKWAESIPDMVQGSFVNLLGQRAGLVGVIPSSGARTDTRVHLTIKSFEARFDQGEDAAPNAVVHYSVTLSNASDRKLLGTYDIKKTVRSADIRVSKIVEAMDKANQQALNSIADWLETPEVRGKV
jgi:cholesterol transport system auxiliary component